MIIEYDLLNLRYKDQNILAIGKDGADYIVYLKNGCSHRILASQSTTTVDHSILYKKQKHSVSSKADSIPSLASLPQKKSKKKTNRTKLEFQRSNSGTEDSLNPKLYTKQTREPIKRSDYIRKSNPDEESRMNIEKIRKMPNVVDDSTNTPETSEVAQPEDSIQENLEDKSIRVHKYPLRATSEAESKMIIEKSRTRAEIIAKSQTTPINHAEMPLQELIEPEHRICKADKGFGTNYSYRKLSRMKEKHIKPVKSALKCKLKPSKNLYNVNSRGKTVTFKLNPEISPGLANLTIKAFKNNLGKSKKITPFNEALDQILKVKGSEIGQMIVEDKENFFERLAETYGFVLYHGPQGEEYWTYEH